MIVIVVMIVVLLVVVMVVHEAVVLVPWLRMLLMEELEGWLGLLFLAGLGATTSLRLKMSLVLP